MAVWRRVIRGARQYRDPCPGCGRPGLPTDRLRLRRTDGDRVQDPRRGGRFDGPGGHPGPRGDTGSGGSPPWGPSSSCSRSSPTPPIPRRTTAATGPPASASADSAPTGRWSWSMAADSFPEASARTPRVSEEIASLPAGVILSDCYSQDNPTSCGQIVRDADTKLISHIVQTNTNVGETETAGLDLRAAYTATRPWVSFRRGWRPTCCSGTTSSFPRPAARK